MDFRELTHSAYIIWGQGASPSPVQKKKCPLSGHFLSANLNFHHLGSQMSLMAVRSSPSIWMLVKAGTQMRSTPMGAR